jgi:uncharacterized protein with PQ loop repeat
MDAVDLLGWIGVAFTFARLGSQPWHNLRSRRLEGVSAAALGNSVASDVGWLVYGLAMGLPPVWVVAALVLPVGVLSLVVARSQVTLRSVVAVASWSVLLAGSWFLAGPVALGSLLVVGVAMAMIPQLAAAFRLSSLAGLSLVTVGLALADASAWAAYGAATAEAPLLFYGAVLGIASVVTGWRVLVTRQRSASGTRQRPTPVTPRQAPAYTPVP